MATLEQVKEYWDRRPCNINHSKAAIGTKEYFDEVEFRKYKVEPHIPAFAEFDKWNNKEVLEVGCGIGTDAVNFARAGANYTGVDLSNESIKMAVQRFRVFKLPGIFTNVRSEEIPIGRTFDLVYSFGVVHHTPDPHKMLKEMARLLKPDGELRIMIYAKDSFKDAMIEANLDQPEAQSGCPIANTYTQEQAREMLGNAGFDVIEITQDHIFPYVIEDYVNHRYVLQPWIEAMPHEMFRALEKRFGWHMLIKASPSALPLDQ